MAGGAARRSALPIYAPADPIELFDAQARQELFHLAYPGHADGLRDDLLKLHFECLTGLRSTHGDGTDQTVPPIMDRVLTALKRNALGSCILSERIQTPACVQRAADNCIPGFHRQDRSAISAEAALQVGDSGFYAMPHGLITFPWVLLSPPPNRR